MFYEAQIEVIRLRVCEPGPEEQAPRLFDEIRRVMRLKHYSLRTEGVYLGWIRRFILANGRRHPRAMGAQEIEHFLSSLAVDRHVAANTQNQTVGASQADRAALFWNETTSWGTVYLSPFQSAVNLRFGTTQAGNSISYTRPTSVGSAFTLTEAIKDGTTDAL